MQHFVVFGNFVFERRRSLALYRRNIVIFVFRKKQKSWLRVPLGHGHCCSSGFAFSSFKARPYCVPQHCRWILQTYLFFFTILLLASVAAPLAGGEACVSLRSSIPNHDRTMICRLFNEKNRPVKPEERSDLMAILYVKNERYYCKTGTRDVAGFSTIFK